MLKQPSLGLVNNWVKFKSVIEFGAEENIIFTRQFFDDFAKYTVFKDYTLCINSNVGDDHAMLKCGLEPLEGSILIYVLDYLMTLHKDCRPLIFPSSVTYEKTGWFAEYVILNYPDFTYSLWTFDEEYFGPTFIKSKVSSIITTIKDDDDWDMLMQMRYLRKLEVTGYAVDCHDDHSVLDHNYTLLEFTDHVNSISEHTEDVLKRNKRLQTVTLKCILTVLCAKKFNASDSSLFYNDKHIIIMICKYMLSFLFDDRHLAVLNSKL